MGDLYKISKSLEGKDSQQTVQFKLNQVTVSVLILLILLQIVSTVLTLPIGVGEIGYNILDCVVCLQYVGLTYFFFDLSKNGRDC